MYATSKNSLTAHSQTNFFRSAPSSLSTTGPTRSATSSELRGKHHASSTPAAATRSRNFSTAGAASAPRTGSAKGSATSAAAAKKNEPSSSRSTSTSEHAGQTTTIPREIHWAKLSPRGRMILLEIAQPITMGYTEIELAKMIGVPKSTISDWLQSLREELEADDA